MIATDFFAIPWDDKYILYAPYNQLAVLVTDGAIRLFTDILKNKKKHNLSNREKMAIQLFSRLGFFNKIDRMLDCSEQKFYPNHVTLFLTNQCNMRCLYCYASGGEKDNCIMPLNIAKNAIDFVVSNAIFNNQKVVAVSFHGGGEPTMAWQTLKDIVEYAKRISSKEGLILKLGIATNGILSKDKILWIMDNFHTLNLSFDGSENIQNYHRPLSNGEKSFSKVMKTVKRMDKKSFKYGIRVTVTDFSVKYMDKIVDFFCRTCDTKSIHLEPTFSCGRCLSSNINSPSAEQFISGFRKAQKVADRFKATLFYSGARLGIYTTNFCKASGDSFCVTPEGDVTSCYEVCSADDPRSEIFFYGKYNATQKSFDIYEEKRLYLQQRNVKNIEYCKNCFCKFHCAGDCMAKVTDGKNLLEIIDFARCKINRALTLDKIVNILKANSNQSWDTDIFHFTGQAPL